MMHQKGVPLDIIHEIRGRLPPKSLVRFRCVSKAWNDITNDLDLARKQLHRAGKIRDPQLACLLTRIRGEKGPIVTSKITEQRIEIRIPFNSCFKPTCCIGWHCFGATFRSYDGLILMHNPLRQETFGLPQIPGFMTKDGNAWYGLGFDGTNNLFKLTCLFTSNSSSEFYILRQKHFWEQLELPSHLRNCRDLLCNTVFLNGSIHYAVRLGDRNHIYIILAFDVENEQFRCINLPHRYRNPHIVLMDLGGLLAVYCKMNIPELDVLKDYAKGEWDAPLRLPVNESVKRLEEGKIGMDIVNNGIMVTQVFSGLRFTNRIRGTSSDEYLGYIAYDIQNGKFIDIVFSQIPCSSPPHYSELYGHQLSIVPLNM